MKSWRQLLGVIVVFIVVDAILFFFLFAKTSKTSIGFISLKPGYLWNIDKSKKDEFENKLIEAGANTGKILVVMSADNKRTSLGTGWGEGDPAYFGEWKAVAGYDVLTFYSGVAWNGL